MWKTTAIYTAIFLGTRYSLMLLMQQFAKRFHQKINPKPIQEAQILREGMWPVGLLLDGLMFILLSSFGMITFEGGPFLIAMGTLILSHILIVEPIYYLYHRLLHTPWLYKNHHVYHHKSIVVDPITSMSFTLLERFSYTLLFGIPVFILISLGIFNFFAMVLFFIVFDILNGLGHLNVELETKRYKRSKILKWLIYSPEYHEKHHSLVTTNYALFMPIFDRIFKTCTAGRKSVSLKKRPESIIG